MKSAYDSCKLERGTGCLERMKMKMERFLVENKLVVFEGVEETLKNKLAEIKVLSPRSDS